MKFLLSLLLFYAFSVVNAQIVVSGRVTANESGEKLIGVTCYDSTSKKATSTNDEGYYSFSTEQPAVTLTFSFVGFESITKRFTESGVYNLELKSGLLLDEVVVLPKVDISQTFSQIDARTIQRLPNLLGESDVIKSLQYLPGVQGGTEGSASIFVRGGGADQNLVLWDDALIYNVYHLGGFFSVFNPHLVKKVELFKSYIPAEYGGRGSSVISISTKEGSKSEFGGNLDIGILNQNLTIEGPLQKEKSSFIVSARNSNLGVLTSLRNSLSRDRTSQNTISFYDISARINSRLGKNGQLTYSFFHGADQFESVENFSNRLIINSLKWSNTVQSLKYTQSVNSRLFLKSAISQTVYNSSIAFEEEFQEEDKLESQKLNNKISDVSGKIQLQFTALPSLVILGGAEIVNHSFQPSFQNTLEGISDRASNKQLNTTEGSLFINSEFKPTDKLNFDIGLRRSNLWSAGSSYGNWEPRLNLDFYPSASQKIFLSYTQMNQYMHSLSNTGTGFNVEVWVQATDQVAPLKVESISTGYVSRFKNGVTWQQEAYFKNFFNSIMYREGENLSIFQGDDWYEKVSLNGRGRSWGIENTIGFTGSKVDVKASYTWSKTEFNFADINNNQWFPFKYDRRHYFTFTGLFDLKNQWEFNTAFILQSGQAFTAPQGLTVSSFGFPEFYYSSINNARFPVYHRLDIGFTKTKITKKEREAKWSFGAFNLYNRQNPAYLDIELKSSEGLNSYQIVPKGLLPIIPYLKYQIKF